MTTFALAADVGGTHSRVQLLEVPSGRCAAQTEGPGFNIRSSGDPTAAGFESTLRDALEHAQQERPGDLVLSAAHVGVAGAGPARHAEVTEIVAGALTRAAVACGASLALGLDTGGTALCVSDDLVTAYAGGLRDDDDLDDPGILLLGGTGAAAASCSGRRIVARRDGMGWLLGDIGSAVWIGREALAATAADLDGRGPATLLTDRVLASLAVARDGGDVRQHLIAAADRLAPAAWGGLAPLVSHAASEDGGRDLVARDIAARAVEAHLDNAQAMRAEVGSAVHRIALAGSVLTSPGPIGDVVRYALEADGWDVRLVSSPLDGAARLALALARGSSPAQNV